MGRKSLDNKIRHRLDGMMRIGESRHKAKAKLRAALGDDYRFEMSIPTIHSYNTRKTYEYVCLRFGRWCKKEKGVHEYGSLEDCQSYVIPYLTYRTNQGLSVYTLKTERAALGKLYGNPIDYPIAKRTPDQITRSRHAVAMDEHFDADKYPAQITLASACGYRREDLDKARTIHLREINGIMFLDVYGSKGGRDRTSPITPGREAEVLAIVEAAQSAGKEYLVESIPTRMDVHSYRRAYAQELYKAVSTDPDYKAKLMAVYPPRREKVKSDYTTRRKGLKNKTFLRDDLYCVTQALGHTRLDVTVTHYLMNWEAV